MLYLARAFARGNSPAALSRQRGYTMSRELPCVLGRRVSSVGDFFCRTAKTHAARPASRRKGNMLAPDFNRRRGPALLASRAQGAVTRTCNCQCRSKTPAILPVLTTAAAVPPAVTAGWSFLLTSSENCPTIEDGRRSGGDCWRAPPRNTRLDSSRTMSGAQQLRPA